MKHAAWAATLIGMAILIGLMVHQGFGEVAHALAQAGWGLLWLIPLHALPLALDAQGWRVLLTSTDTHRRATLPFLLWVASVREAVARLLPTIGIGGELVGIRLAMLRLQDTSAVSATIIIEVLLTMAVQYAFSALGVILILRSTLAVDDAWVILVGLLLSLPIPILVAWLLRHGAIFERLEALAKRLLGHSSSLASRIDGTRLDANIHALFAQPKRLFSAFIWQFSGYLSGAIETWLALYLLGYPVSIGTAIAIEALTQAVRHMMFMIPGGLGVQEAGIMLFANMAGLGGEVGLSLALIKRLREILFGVPILLSWQFIEIRLLRRATLARKGAAA